eukprot:Lithocolla_globosa_v1_NODE_1043_length_2920_cov_340.169284.p4 type:complete len:103 gc:universal NODE_1043_length_2920_cov_340.169284:474-166(-)
MKTLFLDVLTLKLKENCWPPIVIPSSTSLNLPPPRRNLPRTMPPRKAERRRQKVRRKRKARLQKNRKWRKTSQLQPQMIIKWIWTNTIEPRKKKKTLTEKRR